MNGIKKLLVEHTVTVSAAEIRDWVKDRSPDASIRDYFRTLIPSYTPQRIESLKKFFADNNIPLDVACELLCMMKYTKTQEIALVCNSLGYKMPVKTAELVLQNLRKI